ETGHARRRRLPAGLGRLVPLQGAQRGPDRRPPLLPEPGAPLGADRCPGGQRAAQRQRPPAVGGARRLGWRGRGAAGLRPQLLLGWHLHPLPVRQRPAGRQLPGLPAARRARHRALPPVPPAMRGVQRGAGQHAGHRHRHDGRGGRHLRHAGRHLPPGGLRHREPHAAGLRRGRPAQKGHDVGRGEERSGPGHGTCHRALLRPGAGSWL
uniref:Uncharacterized protein n=1 Tax=Pelusios castaneus TaxID=367368 RepID=A0A8C8RET1_9SAUR